MRQRQAVLCTGNGKGDDRDRDALRMWRPVYCLSGDYKNMPPEASMCCALRQRLSGANSTAKIGFDGTGCDDIDTDGTCAQLFCHVACQPC